MSNYFGVDLSTLSFDEVFPQTPRGYQESSSFFTPNTLRDGIRLTPSAWQTPHRYTDAGLIKDAKTPGVHHESACGTGASFPSLVGTPVTHRTEINTPGPSQSPHGAPGVSQAPMGNIGVTPARIMGPYPRNLRFDISAPPFSPTVAARRKISMPKRLRNNWLDVQRSQEQMNGPDLLDVSLFGVPSPPLQSPAAPFDGTLLPYAAPGTEYWLLNPPPSARTIYSVLYPSLPGPSMTTSSVPNISPLEAPPIRGNVETVDRTGDATGPDGEGEDAVEDHEGGGASGSETGGVIHHANTLTEQIHCQRSAQNGGAAGDGLVWLPFPYDQDRLVMYLEEGLSLRHLFPNSQQGTRIRCEAELELVGNRWRRTRVCNETKGSLENYQRHIKSKYLGATRESDSRVAVDHIANTVWNYTNRMVPRPRSWLRVQPWDDQMQDFPRFVAPPDAEEDQG